MSYILIALLSLIVPFISYRANWHNFFTKNETSISVRPLGKIRSCIFVVSLILSIALDFLSYFIDWISLYADSAMLMYTPLSSIYTITVGPQAGFAVLFVILLEMLLISAISVLRGIAIYLVIKYVMVNNCTEYKFVKRIPLLIAMMFIIEILFGIALIVENYVVLEYTGTTGESPDISVVYYVFWLCAFLNLCIMHRKNRTPIPSGSPTEPIPTKNDPPALPNAPTSPAPGQSRLAELEAELKKIPVAKVKQWHSDGKITDEQYKAIARKYNSIKKEIEEIKERMEVLKNIE